MERYKKLSMNKKSQKLKILDILKDYNWHCVNQFIDTYCVDYRRRLKDLRDGGYILESKRCDSHGYHKGGSKEWRILGRKESVSIAPRTQKMPLPSDFGVKNDILLVHPQNRLFALNNRME